MPITKERAIEACYDNNVVHDDEELGKLLSLLTQLSDEKLAILRTETSNKAIVAFVRAQMAGAATSVTPPVSIRVIYPKARDKTLSSQMFTFQARPTFEQLQERIELAHPDLRRIDYSLCSGDMVIDKVTWGMMDLRSKRGKPATVVVESNRKPFSEYNTQMGLELLDVTCIEPDVHGSVFQEGELALDEELPREIQQRTTWRTNKDVLQHLANDMVCRSHISEPPIIGKESAKRELISPILMAAATMVGGTKVYAEYVADGVRANGFVDWVFLFKHYNIVVVEAKDSLPFDEFTGQLAAKMVAVREDFAMSVLKKRKLEAASCMMEVPSYGILSNGYIFQFFKYYMDESNNKVFMQSNMASLNMESAQSHEQALAAVTKIVKFVVHILRSQVSAISQSQDLKKARI